jgi:hypothetical protein
MSFSTDETFVGIGLWVGTQVGNTLPIAPSDDAQDPDGYALHLSGEADERGADTYWHIGAALDRIYARVLFRAKTERPEGQPLIVALAGSSSTDYFGDLEQARPWRASSLAITPEWQDWEVAFADLRPLGPGEPAPTFEPPWSAVHLIMPPNAPFDLWLSHFELRSDR